MSTVTSSLPKMESPLFFTYCKADLVHPERDILNSFTTPSWVLSSEYLEVAEEQVDEDTEGDEPSSADDTSDAAPSSQTTYMDDTQSTAGMRADQAGHVDIYTASEGNPSSSTLQRRWRAIQQLGNQRQSVFGMNNNSMIPIGTCSERDTLHPSLFSDRISRDEPDAYWDLSQQVATWIEQVISWFTTENSDPRSEDDAESADLEAQTRTSTAVASPVIVGQPEPAFLAPGKAMRGPTVEDALEVEEARIGRDGGQYPGRGQQCRNGRNGPNVFRRALNAYFFGAQCF